MNTSFSNLTKEDKSLNCARRGEGVGDSLYGVDIKERDGKAYVIEINDNPNIDSEVEDLILGDDLYLKIIQEFVNRIEKN